MHGLKPFFVGLYVHVIASYRSTFLGLLVAGVAYGLAALQHYPNTTVQIIAGLVLAPFLAWKDKAVAQGQINIIGGTYGGFARVRFLAALAFAGLFLSVACSAFKPSFAADEKACAVAGLHDIEAAAASILLTGGANYESQLLVLARQVGTDTLVCAVQAAIADFELNHVVDAGAPQVNALVSLAPPADSYSAAAARGRAYLARHGR